VRRTACHSEWNGAGALCQWLRLDALVVGSPCGAASCPDARRPQGSRAMSAATRPGDELFLASVLRESSPVRTEPWCARCFRLQSWFGQLRRFIRGQQSGHAAPPCCGRWSRWPRYGSGLSVEPDVSRTAPRRRCAPRGDRLACAHHVDPEVVAVRVREPGRGAVRRIRRRIGDPNGRIPMCPGREAIWPIS
jgi:hypothetical protein